MSPRRHGVPPHRPFQKFARNYATRNLALPTAQPSTAPLTSVVVWVREVLRGVVNSPSINGMQGVRGSNPLSSTTTTPQVLASPLIQRRFWALLGARFVPPACHSVLTVGAPQGPTRPRSARLGQRRWRRPGRPSRAGSAGQRPRRSAPSGPSAPGCSPQPPSTGWPRCAADHGSEAPPGQPWRGASYQRVRVPSCWAAARSRWSSAWASCCRRTPAW